MRLRLRRLAHGHGLPLPERASPGSAGLDLRAAVGERLTIAPGERQLVPTGFAVEVPAGWEAQVRPRSGLAWRHGLTVLNAPGTVDSDYRGELRILLVNLGGEPYSIERGERVAQLILAPTTEIEWEEVDELAPTDRGVGGFGSTGVG